MSATASTFTIVEAILGLGVLVAFPTTFGRSLGLGMILGALVGPLL